MFLFLVLFFGQMVVPWPNKPNQSINQSLSIGLWLSINLYFTFVNIFSLIPITKALPEKNNKASDGVKKKLCN